MVETVFPPNGKTKHLQWKLALAELLQPAERARRVVVGAPPPPTVAPPRAAVEARATPP